LLALDEALEKFAAIDPRKAELVKLRYYVGLNFEETAAALGIAVPTAKQWWPTPAPGSRGNAERIGLKKWQAKGIELSRGVKLRRGSVLAQTPTYRKG